MSHSTPSVLWGGRGFVSFDFSLVAGLDVATLPVAWGWCPLRCVGWIPVWAQLLTTYSLASGALSAQIGNAISNDGVPCFPPIATRGGHNGMARCRLVVAAPARLFDAGLLG